MDQKELAEKVGVTTQTFSRWKNRTSPPESTIPFIMMANYLNASLDWLFYIGGFESSKPLSLGILKFVKTHPGARIDEITLGMQNEFGPQTSDSIYNQIKRYLRDYLEFKGPKKSGGYHLK